MISIDPRRRDTWLFWITAVLEPLDASFGHDTGFGRQRLPGERGMDGFFYARLQKA